MSSQDHIQKMYQRLNLKHAGIPFKDFQADPIGSILRNNPPKEWSARHRTSATRLQNYYWANTGNNQRNRKRGEVEHERHDKAARKFQSYE